MINIIQPCEYAGETMPLRGPTDELTILRKTAMMRCNLRQTDIAKRWQKSQSFVSQLIRGRVRSKAHERKFARLVGMPHKTLFPEPSKGRGRPKATAA